MQYLYEIRNIINGKRYIGRTCEPEKRWYRHRLELNKGTHHSIYLQRAWDKYGEENFVFNILDTRETLEEIQLLEESYICELNENLYNVSTQSSGGDLISYHPNHDEIVERVKESILKRVENMTEEERQEKSESVMGEKNPNYKHGKYSKAEKERRREEWSKKSNKEKYGHVAWNKGLKLGPGFYPPKSEEARKHMSEAQQNREGTKIVCEGVLYMNLRHAADVYQITREGILVRVNSHTDQWKEFYYFDENIHNEDDYIKYIDGETDIEEIRSRSYIINNYSRVRHVYCEGKIMTVKEALEFYNFKSPNALTYRCESDKEKWKEFYYID